jgi:hypothetical protein
MNAMLRAALATALLASTAVAETTSRNFGITVTPAGSGATITGLSLSSSSFTGGAPSGTAVGNIVVSTSDGSKPALSLIGTDRGSGNDASSFQITGSPPVLQTNTNGGTDQPGQYSICIVASGPYSNSPQQICPTIQATGAGGAGWQLTFSDEFNDVNGMLERLSTVSVTTYTWSNSYCSGLSSPSPTGCGTLTVASLPTGISQANCGGSQLGACDVSIMGATNGGSGGNSAVNGTFQVAAVAGSGPYQISLYMPYSGIDAALGGTIMVGSGPWTLALTNGCSSGTWPSCQSGNHFLAQNDNNDTESYDPHACTVNGGLLSINTRTTNLYVPPASMSVYGRQTSSSCHIQSWPASQFGFAFAQTEELYYDTYAKFPNSGDDTIWLLSAANIWNNGPEIDAPECFGGGNGNCDDRAIGNSGNGSPRPGTSAFMQFGVDVSAFTVTYFQNGRQVNSESNPSPGTMWYPIIDVAGDPSGGNLINGDVMQIDYVRIYKKVTSGACYTSIPTAASGTVPHTGTC